MGYVGTVSAGCLAQDGHEVIGADPVLTKVDLINAGQSPIVEEDIGQIIAAAVQAGRLRATSDADEAIRQTELSFVCVGTPSQANGNLDLTYIRRVCEMIGGALKNKPSRHTVVIRSTILPGTMHQIVIPILEERSKRKAGVDFGVCNNPEFLREGSAVKDFNSPPKTVIGELDRASGDMLAALYAKLEAPFIRTDLETAEITAGMRSRLASRTRSGIFASHFLLMRTKSCRFFVKTTSSTSPLRILRPGSPLAVRACQRICEL
jgi:GDP-mannose 6-dehydrogenase